MSDEKTFDELVADKGKQEKEYEKEISNWMKNLTKEELDQMAVVKESGEKRKIKNWINWEDYKRLKMLIFTINKILKLSIKTRNSLEKLEWAVKK